MARIPDEGGGVLALEGVLVTYGGVNRNGWMLVPGAFKKSLRKIPSASTPLPMLTEHGFTIGRWTQARDSAENVTGKGRISATDRGRETATLLEDEALNGISVGFMPDWNAVEILRPEETLETSTPYGPFTFTAESWVIAFLIADLVEASIVAVPADADARTERIRQSLWTKASRAMPGLRESAEWPDVAYSMALLMGGRGAGRAFEDVDEVERISMYHKLADAYDQLGKTPPPYEREPVYQDVAFEHDERELFADRYLRKSLAGVVAGANGFQGPLSRETREEVDRALAALTDLTRQSTEPSTFADLFHELRDSVRASNPKRKDV